MVTNFTEESELLSLFPINEDNAPWIIKNTYTSTYSEEEKFDSGADYLGNNVSLATDTNSFNIDEMLLLQSLEKTSEINKERDSNKDILTGERREMSAVKSDSLLWGNSEELVSIIDPPVKQKESKQNPNKEEDIVEEIPLFGDDFFTPNSSGIQRRSSYAPGNIVNDPNLVLEIEQSSDPDINAITGKGDNNKKWNLDYLGNQITYGFVVAGGDGYYNQDSLSNHGGDGLAYELTDDAKNTVRSVLNDLEEIIPVDFVETSYSSNNSPIMVFVGVKADASFANHPHDYFRSGGDVFINDENIFINNEGFAGYFVVAHEIAHALGLQHGTRAWEHDVGPFLPTSKANYDVTVMGGNLGPSGTYPTEYGPLDIKALQYLYSSSETEEITPEISISNVTITEGNRGTKNAKFRVTLDEADDEIVTVRYSTSNGSAQAGSDYRSRQGTLTFQPGQTTKTINIPVIGDRKVESKENFFVTLSNPTNAEIADGRGKGTIKNNDRRSSSEPSISITDVSITEGDYGTKNAVFRVRLNTASNSQVKVDYQTVEDTSSFAIPGFDYQSKSGTITFRPGQKTKQIKIPVYGDYWNESNEYFWVYLSNPKSAKIRDEWGFANIIDDD